MTATVIEVFLALGLLAYGAWRGTSALRIAGPEHLAYVLASLSGLTFGAGPLISFVYGGFTLPEENIRPLLFSYGAVAAFLLGVEIVALLYRSRRRPGNTGNAGMAAATTTPPAPLPGVATVVAVYAMVTAARIHFAVEYGVFFSGSGSGQRMSQMPYWSVILIQLTPVLGAGCLLYAMFVFWSGAPLRVRLTTIAIAALECTWLATQGRRNMIEGVVLGLMAFRYAGGRLRPAGVATLIGISAALWFLIFPAFLAVRTSLVVADKSEGTWLGLGSESDVISNPSIDPELARELHDANSITRPLIIRFAVRIFEDRELYPSMNGEAFASSIYRAVPAVFLGGKAGSLAPEQAIQEHYHQPNGDTSITWPAFGAADFGITGALGAGLVFAFVILLSNHLFAQATALPRFIFLVHRAFVLHCCVFVEECPSSLWSGLRNLFVLAVVAWILARAFGQNAKVLKPKVTGHRRSLQDARR